MLPDFRDYRGSSFAITDKGLMHYGTQGMRWGYNDGKPNGKRTAASFMPIISTIANKISASNQAKAEAQRKAEAKTKPSWYSMKDPENEQQQKYWDKIMSCDKAELNKMINWWEKLLASTKQAADRLRRGNDGIPVSGDYQRNTFKDEKDLEYAVKAARRVRISKFGM